MKLHITELAVAMELKTKGMELEVRSQTDALIGRCRISKKGIRWLHSGKHNRDKPYPWRLLSWDDFTTIMKSSRSLKAAIRSARNCRI